MTTWFGIQRKINDFNHCCILLIGVCVTLIAYSHDFQGTAKHMFYTVIGFHVLCAEALVSHYPINRITNPLSYRQRSIYHGILQLTGGSMVLYGVIDKIGSTSEEHFTTKHSIFGLFAAFMCFANMIGGILNFFQPKLIRNIYTHSQLKFRHNLFGLLTFTLGMSAIYLGYFTQFFIKYFKDLTLLFTPITILVFLLTVLPPIFSLGYKWIHLK